MIWVAIDHYDAGQAVRNLVVDEHIVGGKRPGYGGGWVLRDSVHYWLMRRVQTYELTWSHVKHGYWHVGIEDPDVATLFKLTWS